MRTDRSLGFVVIVEYGDLENKAILLAESIRRFLADGHKYPIYAIRPRKGREIRATTAEKFKRLDVNYVPIELNMRWKDFPFANCAYGAAYAETLVSGTIEALIYFDADVVCLKDPLEINMEPQMDVITTPVDSHMAAQEYGCELSPYWKAAFDLNGVNAASLWPVETKVGKVKIYPTFNSGFVAVRPELGIFRRWKESFEKITEVSYFSHLNPLRKEFFFLDQALLASSILSVVPHERINILGANYNYPLHLVEQMTGNGPLDLEEVVFLHYHRSFYDLTWMKHTKMNEATKAWLLSRLPLPRDYKFDKVRTKRELISELFKSKFLNYFSVKQKN
jgi:lipopolysaccharide biosynthesis glycosyltransferase